jgi:hypothetical protein
VRRILFEIHKTALHANPAMLGFARTVQISQNGQSTSAGAIDRATAIYSSGTDHRLSRDRPRPQHDTRPYDAAGRIFNILAVYHSTGLFSARGNETSYQETCRQRD